MSSTLSLTENITMKQEFLTTFLWRTQPYTENANE